MPQAHTPCKADRHLLELKTWRLDLEIRITAKDRDGSVRELSAETGNTVMETLRDAGLPVEAICGGCCSCGTCHVYVDPDWRNAAGTRGADEEELLELSEHFKPDVSRLGCQVPLTEQHNGLIVTLAPEE